jgi:magnesium-transporting ATPase (P-type)
MSQEREKGSPADNTQQFLSQPAHSLSYEDTIKELGTNSDDGLTSAEVKERLQKYGENMLEGDEGVSLAKIVIRQIANAMMLVSRDMKRVITCEKTADQNRFSLLPWLSVSVFNRGSKEDSLPPSSP